MPVPSRPDDPAGEITVALEALRADAALWRRAAADLRVAAATGEGQRLDPHALSFAGEPVAAAYEALWVKAVGLLRAGAENLDAVAAALDSSADTYAAEDAAGAHRLRGVS